jgi:hypothetical protein
MAWGVPFRATTQLLVLEEAVDQITLTQIYSVVTVGEGVITEEDQGRVQEVEGAAGVQTFC